MTVYTCIYAYIHMYVYVCIYMYIYVYMQLLKITKSDFLWISSFSLVLVFK